MSLTLLTDFILRLRRCQVQGSVPVRTAALLRELVLSLPKGQQRTVQDVADLLSSAEALLSAADRAGECSAG